MKHAWLLALVIVAGCNTDAKKAKEVRDALKKYAFEAYPEWTAAHPDKECPPSLADLDEYMKPPMPTDPWGTPIKMMCGKDVPKEAKYFAVMSFGPDKQEGTADDIKSW